jgi:hypothetical protein
MFGWPRCRRRPGSHRTRPFRRGWLSGPAPGGADLDRLSGQPIIGRRHGELVLLPFIHGSPKATAAAIACCGAPSYLAARGMPERPADLARHECLRLARRHRLHDRWRFRSQSGVEEIQVGGHFSSNSGDVLHGWALEGRGLSSEALWDVAEDLQSGRLVECLVDDSCDEIALFAVFHPGHPIPPRVRLFVDFIAVSHLSVPHEGKALEIGIIGRTHRARRRRR